MLAFAMDAQGALVTTREHEERILRKHISIGVRNLKSQYRKGRLSAREAYQSFKVRHGVFNHFRPSLQKFPRKFVRGLFREVSTVCSICAPRIR